MNEQEQQLLQIYTDLKIVGNIFYGFDSDGYILYCPVSYKGFLKDVYSKEVWTDEQVEALIMDFKTAVAVYVFLTELKGYPDIYIAKVSGDCNEKKHHVWLRSKS